MALDTLDDLLKYYTRKLGRPIVLRMERDKTITACYCGFEHEHGCAPGHRVAHCHTSGIHKAPMAKFIAIKGRKFTEEDGYTIVNYKQKYFVPRRACSYSSS